MAANTIYSQYLTDEDRRRRALEAQQTLAQAQAEADAAKGSFTKISTPQAALPTSNEKTKGAVSNLMSAALPANKPAAQTGAAMQSSSSLPTSNDKTMGTVSRLLSAAGGNMQDAPVIATIYNPSMSAPKKAVLKNSVMGGSGFKAADGDAGKLHLMKDGSSYVVDENGVWHWYDPSPIDQGLHGAFKNSNGYIYSYDDMTDDELMSHGYVRGEDGLVRIASDIDALRYAVQSGQMTPAQAAAQYASRQGTYGPGGGGARTGGNPGGNAYQQYLSDYDSRYSYKGGSYGGYDPTDYRARRDAALARAEGMEWDYDPNTDPVWNAYQKQYRREGDRATREAMAQAASMTGGIPSSYAVTAASQAGDYYASQLSDKIPQLYQDAYNRYLQEFQRQLQISDQYQGFDDREYSRSYQASRDAINDARYDQEWAQKLREYADEQNWKAKDWEQYLREYGDKLSAQEREWAYQQERDTINDARYEDETAWNHKTYEDELARKDREYADEQNREDTEYQQYLQEYEDDQNWKAKDWEYKERTYTDKQKDDALAFLHTYGVVVGRYADVLGVPAGTTLDQYYAMYGYDPYAGSGSYSGGSYSGSYSGSGVGTTGGGTPQNEPKVPDDNGGEDDNLYQFSNERHPNGNKMTKAYKSTLASLKHKKAIGTPDAEIRNEIRQLILSNQITNYEGSLILYELGYNSGGGRTSHGIQDLTMEPFGA